MTGVRAAALAALAVLGPLTVWFAGAHMADLGAADRTVATVRGGMAALWTGMGIMAVLAAPAMAAGGAIRPTAWAVLVFAATVMPFLALAWLTGGMPAIDLLRGAAALSAWTCAATAAARLARRAGSEALPVVNAAWQAAMLALLAATWHTWTDWIGP